MDQTLACGCRHTEVLDLAFLKESALHLLGVHD